MADDIRLGRCLNINRCGIADNGGRVRLAPDALFVCTECGRELVDAVPLAKRKVREKSESAPYSELSLRNVFILIAVFVSTVLIASVAVSYLAPVGS